MIIFLYGEDTYRSQQKLKEIIAHYKETHKSGLNLKYFDGKNLSFQDFKDELQVIPMFKEKKLFVLTDVFSNQEFKDSFVKEAKKFIDSDNIVLFYEGRGKLSSGSLFNFLKKQAKSQEFKALTAQKLTNWLKKEFVAARAEVATGVIEEMITSIGNDLWQLSNEVKKLATFKSGDRVEIKDIKLLVRPKIETDIFKTIDAIALKNKKQALGLLHKHLEKGDSPVYLLSMINYQFRNIIGIKDLAEKGKPLAHSGLHPFVIRKSYQQAQKFSFEELKKIYRKIFQVDYNIKTGKADPQTALDLLVVDL